MLFVIIRRAALTYHRACKQRRVIVSYMSLFLSYDIEILYLIYVIHIEYINLTKSIYYYYLT